MLDSKNQQFRIGKSKKLQKTVFTLTITGESESIFNTLDNASGIKCAKALNAAVISAAVLFWFNKLEILSLKLQDIITLSKMFGNADVINSNITRGKQSGK